MYAVVHIGPFIQAEWNHGSVPRANYLVLSSMIIHLIVSWFPYFLYSWNSGLPYWLREIYCIIFRANNEPFKVIINFSRLVRIFTDGECWTYGTYLDFSCREKWKNS
jgi:hypothetical protein